MMTFNIGFIGPQLGISSSGIFRPCRSVIPMGWSSAVSLMQEIAERLTTLAKLPSGHRVRRTAPIPAWLVDTCEVAVATEQPWYHVYFCAMQKVGDGEPAAAVVAMHTKLEQAWEQTGVLSSQQRKGCPKKLMLTSLARCCKATLAVLDPLRNGF